MAAESECIAESEERDRDKDTRLARGNIELRHISSDCTVCSNCFDVSALNASEYGGGGGKGTIVADSGAELVGGGVAHFVSDGGGGE